jgi:hypothetical protein
MERVLITRVILSMLIILFRLFNCYVLLLFKLRVAFYYAFTYATLHRLKVVLCSSECSQLLLSRGFVEKT